LVLIISIITNGGKNKREGAPGDDRKVYSRKVAAQVPSGEEIFLPAMLWNKKKKKNEKSETYYLCVRLYYLIILFFNKIIKYKCWEHGNYT